LGRDDDAPAVRATGRVGAVRLAAGGGGAATSTGGRFWTLVSSSCAAAAALAKTNPDTSPVETDAINKRHLPIPAFPHVTAGCFDFRR
jgi:hypothetical protein